MKTNEEIFQEIREAGMITKSQIQVLKNRSNKAGMDLFDYGLINEINDGIPLTEEQGAQGLAWLRRFIRKDGTSRVFGYREIKIINEARTENFVFWGFYQSGKNNFLPVYGLNGMKYIPMYEPYIVG